MLILNGSAALFGSYVVSMTMMPVTNSGVKAVRQRMTTVSQVCHRLRIWNGMSGWLPWPASKEAREVKVAAPSYIRVLASSHYLVIRWNAQVAGQCIRR